MGKSKQAKGTKKSTKAAEKRLPEGKHNQATADEFEREGMSIAPKE
jgi:hypothetical protein